MTFIITKKAKVSLEDPHGDRAVGPVIHVWALRRDFLKTLFPLSLLKQYFGLLDVSVKKNNNSYPPLVLLQYRNRW